MRVLARPISRDHTGVQAGVKAGVHEPVPSIRWSKGAVHFRGGRDAPRIAPKQHRSHQMHQQIKISLFVINFFRIMKINEV